jgi:hypothetical protein
MLYFNILLRNFLGALCSRTGFNVPCFKFQVSSLLYFQKEPEHMNVNIFKGAKHVCLTIATIAGFCCDLVGLLYVICWPTSLLIVLWIQLHMKHANARRSGFVNSNSQTINSKPSDTLPTYRTLF